MRGTDSCLPYRKITTLLAAIACALELNKYLMTIGRGKEEILFVECKRAVFVIIMIHGLIMFISLCIC
jgi:uncharacterized membrane protein SpoIIM required for sporulation